MTRAADAPVVERFAPSPTGLLHLGHAFSAMLAHDAARAAGGRFLLRIEDLDIGRARPEFDAALREDLLWLGLRWDGEPMRQSERGAAHAAALAGLDAIGLVYACSCTRADIAAAMSAPQEGVEHVAAFCPGDCRERGPDPAVPAAIRLDMARAIASVPVAALARIELGAGPAGESGALPPDPDMLRDRIGDVVLSRKDGAAAYHLAVVVDDAAQGVTVVTRGADLFESAALHRLLQILLGLPETRWRHHHLIRDERGKRLAKRDDARSIAHLRSEGATPAEVRRLVGLPPQGAGLSPPAPRSS